MPFCVCHCLLSYSFYLCLGLSPQLSFVMFAIQFSACSSTVHPPFLMSPQSSLLRAMHFTFTHLSLEIHVGPFLIFELSLCAFLCLFLSLLGPCVQGGQCCPPCVVSFRYYIEFNDDNDII